MRNSMKWLWRKNPFLLISFYNKMNFANFPSRANTTEFYPHFEYYCLLYYYGLAVATSFLSIVSANDPMTRRFTIKREIPISFQSIFMFLKQYFRCDRRWRPNRICSKMRCSQQSASSQCVACWNWKYGNIQLKIGCEQNYVMRVCVGCVWPIVSEMWMSEWASVVADADAANTFLWAFRWFIHLFY